MTEKEMNLLDFEYESNKKIMELPRKEFGNDGKYYVSLTDACLAISKAKKEVESMFDVIGTWKFNNNCVNKPWCSECGCEFTVPVGDLANYCFCPSCGSKMKKPCQKN